MEIIHEDKYGGIAVRFSAQVDDNEIGRAYLYYIYNDLHDEPYGIMEDVYVEETHRGEGIGTLLVQEVIKVAKEKGCYKLLGQSRYGREKVHELYVKLGFKDHGKNFRMDFV